MESFDEIERLHMSGARAVFVPAKNNRVEEEKLAKAFADEGMKLEVFEQVTRSTGAGLVLVDTGVT